MQPQENHCSTRQNDGFESLKIDSTKCQAFGRIIIAGVSRARVGKGVGYTLGDFLTTRLHAMASARQAG
jgi:hypothetical protein